jgi:transposase
VINQLRAVLMERGIVVPQGRDAALSVRVCTLIKDMREEWCDLDRRICAFDNEFAARVREDEGARRLATIPGIGVLNATALVAAIGDGQSFARGRDLSAWLGLFPGSRRPAASRA